MGQPQEGDPTDRIVYLVNLAEQMWHSSVLGIDGKFPECSLFLETLPSLLNSISAMVGMGGGKGNKNRAPRWAELVWCADRRSFVSDWTLYMYISIASSSITPPELTGTTLR